MNYYLAFIRTYGKEEGYYELVKADTKEEAIEAKKIVGNQKLILVTTASHMKRAVMLFEKEDMVFE